jgi:hypothetical protein
VDTIGWFIATLHQLIGHDKTAAVIGEPAGDKSACVICRFERGEETREAVIEAIGATPAR